MGKRLGKSQASKAGEPGEHSEEGGPEILISWAVVEPPEASVPIHSFTSSGSSATRLPTQAEGRLQSRPELILGRVILVRSFPTSKP